MVTTTTISYRRLDEDGDYTFGQGAANFLIDSPEAVGQAVKTRLKLFAGEWFLDINYGTPYNSQILGAGTVSRYDFALQEVILQTLGVLSITEYASQVNPSTREAVVSCTINTVFGTTTVTQSL